jgi:hypothetical protein
MFKNAIGMGYPNGIACLIDTVFVKIDGSTKNNTLHKGEALNYPI